MVSLLLIQLMLEHTGISDPGNRLVAHIQEYFPEVSIVPIPGASAVVTALSISGFPTDNFFVQRIYSTQEEKKRKKFLEEVAGAGVTVVFYESVHRIEKLLSEMTQTPA